MARLVEFGLDRHQWHGVLLLMLWCAMAMLSVSICKTGESPAGISGSLDAPISKVPDSKLRYSICTSLEVY